MPQMLSASIPMIKLWWIASTMLLLNFGSIQTCEDMDHGEQAKQLQCSTYNGRKVLGQVVHQWKYKNGGSNPCELTCWAVAYNFQYSFGKLRDGTICTSKENGVGTCKNGRCESLLMDTNHGTKDDARNKIGPSNLKLMDRPRRVKQPKKWPKETFGKVDMQSQMNSIIDSYNIIIPTFKPTRRFEQFKAFESKKPLNKTEVDVTRTTTKAYKVLNGKPKAKNAKRKRKRKGRKNGKRKDRANLPKYCQRCKKVNDAKKNYCLSDFVLRVKVVRSVEVGTEARHEVHIIKTYKSAFPILTKEYIWAPTLCKCPHLRPGQEHLIMGKVEESSNSRESRLVVYYNSYARRYNVKSAMRILKIRSREHELCKKGSRRG